MTAAAKFRQGISGYLLFKPAQRKTDRHYLAQRGCYRGNISAKVYEVYDTAVCLSLGKSAAMWGFQSKWKHHTTQRNSIQDRFVWTICVWQRLCWTSSVCPLETSGWSGKTSMWERERETLMRQSHVSLCPDVQLFSVCHKHTRL